MGLFADLVLIVHLGFIVFVLFGSLFAMRWAWAPIVHLPALAWGLTIELSSGVCPLTPLENALRQAAGEAEYSTSFVAHYLLPVVYPPGLTSRGQLLLGGGLLLLNGALYAHVLLRSRAARRRGRDRDRR